MDLRVAGVPKQRSALMGAIRSRDVASLGVRGEIENVAISSRAKQHRIARMAANFTRYHVSDDDAFCVAIDHYEIEHFRAGKHLDLASGNLRAHSLVGAEEKLLAGLTSSIERSRNLRAAKGAVCKEPAIFAREGNPLRDTLVDDQCADFG